MHISAFVGHSDKGTKTIVRLYEGAITMFPHMMARPIGIVCNDGLYQQETKELGVFRYEGMGFITKGFTS